MLPEAVSVPSQVRSKDDHDDTIREVPVPIHEQLHKFLHLTLRENEIEYAFYKREPPDERYESRREGRPDGMEIDDNKPREDGEHACHKLGEALVRERDNRSHEAPAIGKDGCAANDEIDANNASEKHSEQHTKGRISS